MAFPTSLDDFTPKIDNTNDVMAVDVNELQTAIEALEAKVGVTNSADTNSLDYIKTSFPFFSNGVFTIPSYTDNGNGTITVGSGVYILSLVAAGSGVKRSFSIAGGNFTLTDNAVNYIVANYNSGTPVVEMISDVTLINETTIIPIFTIFRNGNVLHKANWDNLASSLSNKVHQSIVKTQRYRRESGLTLAEAGTRNLTLTSGIIWTGAVKTVLDAIDTATDNMYFWKHVAGVWTVSTIAQYNNTQYDNGTDLATLSGGRYAVNWIFRGVEDAKHLYVVLGSGDYTLAQAQAAEIPALPTAISSHAVLVGKIIVLKSAATATSIQSAFVTSFSMATPASHNDLVGLQGGAAGDYYHLTGAQATIATQAASTSLSGYLSSTDWNTFNGKVDKSLFDAYSILYADTDNTPAALTVSANSLVGRIGAGIIAVAIDSDLSSVSANDDTVPSAKATKAMGDLKLPLAGGTMTGKIVSAGSSEVGKTYTPATGSQTVALDCAVNNMHIVTGNASGTAITFTVANAVNNQPFIVSILQGSTVSTIAAWFATIRWAGGSAPTLTAVANKRDTFGFIRTGTDTYDGFIIGQNC